MSTFPAFPRVAFLAWCEAHTDVFGSNAAAIGLTGPQALEFTTLTTTAAAALAAQESAQQAAKAATETCLDAFRDLRASAGDTVRLIRAFAEVQSKPSTVYALAEIPAPAPPSPAPPPGTPYDLSVMLLQNGALQLRWKCQNPAGTSGTVYEVFRRNSPTGAFQYVGAMGTRTFTDETLPQGPTSVTYQITAVRSTVRGNPAQFTVNFGTGGGGGFNFVASITNETPAAAKLAA